MAIPLTGNINYKSLDACCSIDRGSKIMFLAIPIILEVGVPSIGQNYVLTSRISERCAFSAETSSGLKNLLTLSLVDSGSATL